MHWFSSSQARLALNARHVEVPTGRAKIPDDCCARFIGFDFPVRRVGGKLSRAVIVRGSGHGRSGLDGECGRQFHYGRHDYRAEF